MIDTQAMPIEPEAPPAPDEMSLVPQFAAQSNLFDRDAEAADQARYAMDLKIPLLESMSQPEVKTSLEIHPAHTVISRRGWSMQEEVVPAFIKISTDFKTELKLIEASSLKVWIFLALSINRNTEQAHPGIRTISAACGMGQKTVIEAVRQLEQVGLLTVHRANRKYNIYEIPAYVSANHRTAVVSEADTQTASEKPQTASEKAQTASAYESVTRLTREPYSSIHTKKPDFIGMTVNQAMAIPELQTFRDATGYFPGCPLWETIYNDLHENQWTLEQIKVPWVEWCKRGYNQKSLSWMEWIGNPIPDRRPTHSDKRGKYVPPNTSTTSDEPTELLKEQQRQSYKRRKELSKMPAF